MCILTHKKHSSYEERKSNTEIQYFQACLPLKKFFNKYKHRFFLFLASFASGSKGKAIDAVWTFIFWVISQYKDGDGLEFFEAIATEAG